MRCCALTMRKESRKRRPAPSSASSEVTGLREQDREPAVLSTGAAEDQTRSRPAPGAEPESITDRLPSLRLTPEGFFDVDRMRASAKSKLKTALTDPAIAEKLGIAAPSGAAPDEAKMFSDSVAPALFHALNSILVAVPRRYGYTAEQSQVMAFTPPEVAQMAPLTGKVLAKHLGGKSKYQDEYLLAAMVLMGIMGKITLLEKSAQVIHMAPRSTGDEAPLPS